MRCWARLGTVGARQLSRGMHEMTVPELASSLMKAPLENPGALTPDSSVKRPRPSPAHASGRRSFPKRQLHGPVQV